ncbi:hypothetical protein C8N24_0688 [Solirubrobacter pauli]|uniref:Uncharacterized protein n=1 Tax=Solirubrobacter pauli TaxID=166793 RepID=A0A660LAH0_9ACTN|nr:hypothetical protein [Solirubrobacter pauli]RKQ90873.1 hypothetical protein C8N24_0688 [Solirubrobacter pauli]
MGRGLKPKPEDEQILKSVRGGSLSMPLWGVSLSEDFARAHGEQWLFVTQGAFHGVPAWQHSGIKQGERELIVGGVYEVLDAARITTVPSVVRLREIGSLWPPAQHTPGTWSVEERWDCGALNRPPVTYTNDDGADAGAAAAN